MGAVHSIRVLELTKNEVDGRNLLRTMEILELLHYPAMLLAQQPKR